jgi:hypothetical protein
MTKNKKPTDISRFELPATGTDPVTKGTFTIEWAYMYWDPDEDGEICRAKGKFIISSAKDNPLYKIAEKTPVRLQGLLANVDFGVEKRFIRLESLSNYIAYPSMNDSKDIELESIFIILDNLEYLEGVQDYKDGNLL